MRSKTFRVGFAVLLPLVAVSLWWAFADGRSAQAAPVAAAVAERAQPVDAVPARRGEIRVVQHAVGSVAPQQSVTVRSRVDGQLLRVLFEEGQDVRAGQVLAELDPRPFQARLSQVEGQAARNRALLRNAEADLSRYRELGARSAVSQQQLSAQESLVQQYQGAVLADQGLVDSARLELEFTRITAPIAGRIGLRRVDAGNNIRSDDAQGLAVIHQTRPIAVLFSVPEDALPSIAARLAEARRTGQALPVEVSGRGGRQRLARGELATLDNQIDGESGTIRLKARFANDDGALFPNQFVNVQLVLQTRQDAVLVPQAAIQRGNAGPFVYAVNGEGRVSARAVTPGATDGDTVEILQGLAPGEPVVISGTDRLREGARVALAGAAASP